MKQESREFCRLQRLHVPGSGPGLGTVKGPKAQNVPLHSDVHHTAKACQGHGVVWNSLWLLCIGTGIQAAAAANETYS